MSVQLEIQDEIVASMRIPLPEMKKELTKELAFALYGKRQIDPIFTGCAFRVMIGKNS